MLVCQYDGFALTLGGDNEATRVHHASRRCSHRMAERCPCADLNASIGYLSTGTPPTDAEPYLIPFRQGLNALGYIEDRNVAIEYRWAEFKNERLQDLAAD